MRLLTAEPDRFAAAVVANTGLPTGDRSPTDAFLAWQRFSQEVTDFDCGAIVSMGTTTDLPEDVVAAYNAPFPDDTFCAGPRRFPLLVPTSPDDPSAAPNRAAWEVLERWEKPLVTAFSDSDPITRGGDRVFVNKVPGALRRSHYVIEGGGHFLQEDRGPELAAVVIDAVMATDACDCSRRDDRRTRAARRAHPTPTGRVAAGSDQRRRPRTHRFADRSACRGVGPLGVPALQRPGSPL
ncbi:MAG: hypothetical protein V9E94_11600 [Microthrixaceae bacterium]